MLFDRVCQIEIGKPGQKGKLIEGLRMVFTVEKTCTITPNTLDLEVYNLSEASRAALSEAGASIFLRAGYAREAGPEMLFVGNPTFVRHEFPIPEVVTRVECGDGQRELAQTQISESFEAGTPWKQILQKVASKLKLPLRALPELPETSPAHGASFVGPGKEALDSIARSLGLEWSIQNGELQFVLWRKPSQTRAVVLSASTGLLGSPERLNDPGNTLLDLSHLERWKVRCLLQPRIEPGGLVIVESRSVRRAEYVVESVRHHGDTHGETWETEVEVFRP